MFAIKFDEQYCELIFSNKMCNLYVKVYKTGIILRNFLPSKKKPHALKVCNPFFEGL